jgi:splicing factor U2AF subunit
MWANPRAVINNGPGSFPRLDEDALQMDFDDFYEEIFDEVSKFGYIEELNIAGNIGDHLIGNVYIKFGDEEDAQTALAALTGRYYMGRPLHVEYSPVSDFREARCRQFDEQKCNRGGLCNFMHLIQPYWRLKDELFKKQSESRKKSSKDKDRDRSRSRSRDR